MCGYSVALFGDSFWLGWLRGTVGVGKSRGREVVEEVSRSQQWDVFEVTLSSEAAGDILPCPLF